MSNLALIATAVDAQVTPASRPATAPLPVSGAWAGLFEKLDNGEDRLFFVDFKQHGSALTGTFHTLGGEVPLSGIIDNGKFKLFWADDPNGKSAEKPLIQGVLSGQNILVTIYGKQMLMHPETAADGNVQPAYIPLSPLHNVPWNGLAKTPPMGWNSWNKFRSGVSDAVVREIADAMVSSGMRDAGYVYLNIDDTWEGVRDARSVLQPNHKFPDMKALADYVHARGLKLGLYSSPGPRTCGGYPGSYGHEELDAKTWASWGIDFVKYDWCSAGLIYKNNTSAEVQSVYQKMGDALRTSGRPIVFSLCEYGVADVQKWAPQVGGNLWRTTGDIRDTWQNMSGIGFNQNDLAPYAGPGHWNDPDMLEVGNGAMTEEEYRTHISLWSLLSAPLLAGNDVRSMPPATKEILMNREVIAIDQDTLGQQAKRMAKAGDVETWTKHLADGALAVGVFNRGESPAIVTIQASDLHLSHNVTGRDLWLEKRVAFINGSYSATVPKHGVLLLRVSNAAPRQP